MVEILTGIQTLKAVLGLVERFKSSVDSGPVASVGQSPLVGGAAECGGL